MYFCGGPGPGRLQRRAPSGSAELRQAASGERHSLLLLSDGTVHARGDNSRGQLGRRGAPRGRGHEPGERGAQVRAWRGSGRREPGSCAATEPERNFLSFAFPDAPRASFCFQFLLKGKLKATHKRN